MALSQRAPDPRAQVCTPLPVREKAHEHLQNLGIVLGVGGWQKCVYVFFRGHSLWGINNVVCSCSFRVFEND